MVDTIAINHFGFRFPIVGNRHVKCSQNGNDIMPRKKIG
jgi:hypothetical protein